MNWIFGPFVTVSFVLFAVSSIRLLFVLWRVIQQSEDAIELTWKLSTSDRWVLFVFVASGMALCYGIPNHL